MSCSDMHMYEEWIGQQCVKGLLEKRAVFKTQ